MTIVLDSRCYVNPIMVYMVDLFRLLTQKTLGFHLFFLTHNHLEHGLTVAGLSPSITGYVEESRRADQLQA
jgi:hypothetical protein